MNYACLYNAVTLWSSWPEEKETEIRYIIIMRMIWRMKGKWKVFGWGQSWSTLIIQIYIGKEIYWWTNRKWKRDLD